jgi:hypothetical protein
MIDAERPLLSTPEAAVQVDVGLRSFLRAVLAKTALGLTLAGGVAYAISSVPAVRDLLFHLRVSGQHTSLALTGPGLLVVLSPIPILLLSMGPQTRLRSAMTYWGMAASIGAAGSIALLTYTGVSAATTFAAAAAGFGALSLYGYTTRRDLSAARAFLTTGLVGLAVALGLNLFLGSAALAFALNVVGVLVFAGLIAHDMQRLKLIYRQTCETGDDLEIATYAAALCCFLNFVNFYQFLLLTVSGQRR